MDIDIYADLDFDLGKKFVELEKKNEELTQEINKLEGTVNVLNEEVSQIKEVNEVLKINISELYKTALAELQRKNRALAETRKELDELIVRRAKQETNYDQNEYQRLLIEFKKQGAQAIEKDKEISILKAKLELESKKVEELKRKNESSSNSSGYKRGYVDEDSDERVLKRSRYGRSDEKINHDEYKDHRNRHNSKDYQDDRYPNRDYRRYHFNSRFRSKRRFHENDRGFHKRRYESHKNRYDNFDSQRNEDYYNERAPIEENAEYCDNIDEGNIDLQRKYPSDFNSQKLSRLKENSRNDAKNSEWKLNLIEGNTTIDGPKFLAQTENTRIESNQSHTTKEEIFKKYGLPPPPDLKSNKSDLSVITELIQSEIEQAKLNRTDKVVKDVVKSSTELLENFDPNLSFELRNEIQELAADNVSDKKPSLEENKPRFVHPKKVLQDRIFKLPHRKSVTENKNDEKPASETIPHKEKESNTLLTEQVEKNWTDVTDLKNFKIPKRRKSTLETITELSEDNTVTNETSALEFQHQSSVDTSKTFEKVNNFKEVNDLDKINIENKIKKAEKNDFMRNWLKGKTTKQENSSRSGKDMEKLQELYNVNDLEKSFEEETITLNYAYEMEEGEVLDSPVKGSETIQISSDNVYIETVTVKENVIQQIEKPVEVPLKSSSKKEIILKRSTTKVESIPEKEIIPDEKHKKEILIKPTTPDIKSQVELKNIEPDVNLNIIEGTPKRPKQSPNTKLKKMFERKTNKYDIKDKSQKHPKLKIVRLKTDKESKKNQKHNYRVLDITETVEKKEESAKLQEDDGYLSSSQKEKEGVEKTVEMKQERKEIKQLEELNQELEETKQNCQEKHQERKEKNQERGDLNQKCKKLNQKCEVTNQRREEKNQTREEKDQGRENVNQERKETYKKLEEASSKLKETHQKREETHRKLEEKHSKREQTYKKHEKSYSRSGKTHSEHEKSHSKIDKKHSEHEKSHSKFDKKDSEYEKSHSKHYKTHSEREKTHSECEKTHPERERSHSKREKTGSEQQKTTSKHNKTHLESENTHSEVEKINQDVKKSNPKLQETHVIRKERREKSKETNEKLEKPSHRYEEINQQREERNQQIEKYNQENDETNQENEETDRQLEEAVKSILSKSAEKQNLETDKMFITEDIFQQNNASKHKINILKVEEIDESNKIDVQKILKQVKHSADNTITLFSNSEISATKTEIEDTIKIKEALRDYNAKKRLDLHAVSDSDDNIEIVGNNKKKVSRILPTLYEGSLDDEKSSNIEIVRSKSPEMTKSNTEISLQANQPQKLSGVNRRKNKEPTKINRIVEDTDCITPTRLDLERNLNKIFEKTPRKGGENNPEIDKNNDISQKKFSEKTQMQQGRRIEHILSKKRRIFEDILQCKRSSEHKQTEEEGPPLKMIKDRNPKTEEFSRNESREDDMKNIDVETDQRRNHSTETLNSEKHFTQEDKVASYEISGVTIVPTENLDISQRGLYENTQKMDEGVTIAPLTVEFPRCFDDNPSEINDFSNSFKIQVSPEDLAQNICDTGKRFKRPVNPRRRFALFKDTEPPQQPNKLIEKNNLTVEQQTIANQSLQDTSRVFEEATQIVSEVEETTQSSRKSTIKEKPVTESISPQKEVATTTELSTSEKQEETSEKIGEDLEPLPKPKRGRGRPKKIIQANELSQKASSDNDPCKFKRVTRSHGKDYVVPKKRGRKKKEVQVEEKEVQVEEKEKLELKRTPKKNTQVVLPENDSPDSDSSSTDAAESSDSSSNSSSSSSSSSTSNSMHSSSATESALENSPLIRMIKSPGRPMPLQKTPVRGTKSPVHSKNPTFTPVKSPLQATQINLSPKNPTLHTTNIPISSETSSVVVQFLPLSRNAQVLEPTISPLPVVLLNTISPKQYPFLTSPSSALNPATNSPVLNSTSPLSVTRGRQPTIVKKDLLLHTTRALDFSISPTKASSVKPKLSSPKNTTPEEKLSLTPKLSSIKEVIKHIKLSERNAVNSEKGEVKSTSHSGSTITSKIDAKTMQGVAEKSKVTSTSKSQGAATVLEATSKATSSHISTSSPKITATTSVVKSQGVATTSKASVSIHQASKTTDTTTFKTTGSTYETVAKKSEVLATTNQADSTASRNTENISESLVKTSKENTTTSRTTASPSKAVVKTSNGATITSQGDETTSKMCLINSRSITSISEADVKTSKGVSTASKESKTSQSFGTPSQAAETTSQTTKIPHADTTCKVSTKFSPERCVTTSSTTKQSLESTQSKSNPTTSKAIETSSTSKVLSQVATTRYKMTTSTQIDPIKSQETSPELKASTITSDKLNTDQISGGNGITSRAAQENQITSQLTVTTSRTSPVKSGTISTTSQVISTTPQLNSSTSQTATASEVNLATSGESEKMSETASQSSEATSKAPTTGGAPQTTTNPAPPPVKGRRRRCVITIS